jgi:hypothetical protein
MYVLDGIATANGEVGISGSRSSPCLIRPLIGKAWRAQKHQLVLPGTCCINNFKFQSVVVTLSNHLNQFSVQLQDINTYNA